MATTLGSKRTLCELRNEDGDRDISIDLGDEDARWLNLCLLGRPVRPSDVLVGRSALSDQPIGAINLM